MQDNSLAVTSAGMSGLKMSDSASNSKRREYMQQLLVRHHDLEQNKDKAQGTLVSILFMTQITELKMLLDIGRGGHQFYEFVLSLLVASIALLILVGMLIMYIGNLRYNRERKKQGWRFRLKQCLLCRCRLACNCKKKRKRASSYVCVPIGVGAPDGGLAMETTSTKYGDDSDSDSDDGCCRCHWPKKRRPDELSPLDVGNLDATIEAARVKVANAVVKIVKATNRVEEAEEALKKHPRDADLEDELRRARNELQNARREKEQADSEQHFAESQRQQAYIAKEQWEDRDEKKVFKTVTRWQHLTTYLLYFICLMNIFITAFGIYGGRTGNNQPQHPPPPSFRG